MITFNELRLNDERDSIIVDCQIEDVDIYDNAYIKAVYLEYYKNVDATSVGTPSSKAIQIFPATDGENDDTSIRALRIIYNQNQIPDTENFGTAVFENGLFYIIVQCDYDGQIADEDESMTDVGVVLDWFLIYQIGMSYASALSKIDNFCYLPSEFETLVLMWYAIRLSIDVGDWNRIMELWPKFVRTAIGNLPGPGGCGCN